MAAKPWKPLYWERYSDSFAIAGAARDRLAAVLALLSTPLHAGDEHAARIGGENLWEAARLISFALCSLGTVELLAVRYLRTDDAAEVRGSSESARGEGAGQGRLRRDERLLVLAAIQTATQLLDDMKVLRATDPSVVHVALPRLASDASLVDVALPRLHSTTGSPSAAPTRVGVQSDAAWTMVGGAVPGFLLRVALSGALPDLEAAQAALLDCAESVDKLSLSTVYPAAEYSASYTAAFRALDAAHAALSGLLALKTQAGVLLLRCAPQLGLDRGGQRWLAWEAASADAERHGRAALDHLWSASALTDCTFGGLLAWAPPSSAGQEARQLLQRAVADAGEARKAGDHLRHAAAREFYQAWSLLSAPSS
ncbi:unnamed protein product [Alopecurus aequalis]